jgi:hypothetical protein
MTYYTPPKRRFALPQTLITILAIFCFFGWMQERDERAREVTELHQTLAAVKTECAPIIDLSMPVEWELIES